MRRFAWMLFVLTLCLAALPAARAAEYAAVGNTAIVQDMAGVLSDDTVSDLETLNGRMEKDVGRLLVITRHFLGGADVRAYAEEMFSALRLSDRDALLLLVIGEEDYALAVGSEIRRVLPAESQSSLLAQNLRAPYLNRAYDEAAAGFALAYAGQISRAMGEKVSVSGLFGQSDLSATPAPQTWSSFRSDINSMWQDFFGEDFYAGESAVRQARQEAQEREARSSGFWTVVGWIAVVYFLFFRKKKRRRYDFGHGPRRRW